MPKYRLTYGSTSEVYAQTRVKLCHIFKSLIIWVMMMSRGLCAGLRVRWLSGTEVHTVTRAGTGLHEHDEKKVCWSVLIKR